MAEGVDWNKVAQTGCEALATSFGTAAGGPLGTAFGQALAGVIFGGDKDDALKADILNSLTRIESKLDEVIKFIYTLPSLVKRVVNDEFIAQDIRELHAQSVDLLATFAVLRARGGAAKKEDYDLLIGSGNACFRKGLAILENGQEWFLAGLHSFTVGLVAYIPAIRHDKAYASGLAVFANEFAKKMLMFIHPGINGVVSFTDELKAAQGRFAQSTLIKGVLLPDTSTQFLLNYAPDMDNPEMTYGSGCWTAIYPDGHIQGNYLNFGSVNVNCDAVPAADVFAAFAATTTPNNGQPVKIASWFPPQRGSDSRPFYDQFQATIYAASISLTNDPAKIEHLEGYLKTIQSLLTSLYAFGAMSPMVQVATPSPLQAPWPAAASIAAA